LSRQDPAEEHGEKKADDPYREELHRSKTWHQALSLASLPEPERTAGAAVCLSSISS
jgi:hypothetical protein